MKFITYPAGIYGANCYIIYDPSTMEGFLIDPGGDGDEIINIIEKNDIKIRFIILTHGHFDHTGGVNRLKGEFKIPVYINKGDEDLVLGKVKQISNPVPLSDVSQIDGYLNDGDTIKFGNEELKIIATPGHTPGGIVVKIQDYLFTGDTLFEGSVGRSDLPGGSHGLLIKSIKEKLLQCSDETLVSPGHGSSTTIKNEREYNPFL